MLHYVQFNENTVTMIDRANERMDLAARIAAEFDWAQNENRAAVDVRDFRPMSLLLEEPAEGTPEEKKAAMEIQIRDMLEAFDSGDAGRKKPYLDRVYDIYETFNAETVDPTNEQDVKQLLAYVALGQTFGSKKKENLQYFAERFGDRVGSRELEAADRYSLAVSFVFKNQVSTIGKDLNTELTLPGALPGFEQYADAAYDLAQGERNRAQAIRDGRPVPDTKLTLLPDMRRFAGLAKLSDAQLGGLGGETKNAAFTVAYMTFANLAVPGYEHEKLVHETFKNFTDAIFIDGKSVRELREEKYPGMIGGDADEMSSLLLLKALTSGKNRVEYAHIEKNGQGEYTAAFHPLRVDMTAAQPTIEEDYSWFRRTFFNWGSMRCKTRQEKQDALMANDPNREQRHAAMLTSFTEQVIEPGLVAREQRLQREEELRRQLEEDKRKRGAEKAAVKERISSKDLIEPGKEKKEEKTKVPGAGKGKEKEDNSLGAKAEKR